MRSGARHSVVGMLSWFAFLPAVFAIGLLDPTLLGLIVIPAGIAAAASLIASRQRVIGRGLQFAVIICMLFGAVAASRMFGPLILMPTLITSYTIVLQAHPWRFFRRAGLALGIVAMTVPMLLELVGVLPASYLFEAGRWIVVPQLQELSRTGTVGLLMVANASMVIVPCVFIAKLRGDLSDVQTRQLVQNWQLRRLGDELVQEAV